ncbi:MAG: hypothetical protein EOM50_17600 [Erysipelotrichia bacterium]|nr:hypothetical protein [Erysipelotrichia bacterium]
MKTNRIFYIAPVNYQIYEEKIGQRLYVGAASRKVASIVHCLRKTGQSSFIVTSPVVGNVSGIHWFRACLLKYKGVPIIFLPAISVRGLNRIIASAYYLFFSIKNIKNTDVVVFYNFFPEYILVAMYMRLCGLVPTLDIEDAPRHDERGFRGLVNRFSFSIMSKLCSKNVLVASNTISNTLSIPDAKAIYGVMSDDESNLKFRDFNAGEIKIIFGGTLCEDTGLNLFFDSIKLFLARNPFRFDKKLTFIITGFGGEDKLKELADCCSGTPVTIDIRSNLSSSDYRKALDESHVGLSLKLPDRSMGNTTFPSKVVEIVSSGLLLLSTKVSDVPLLFDENQAIFIDLSTPESLCDSFEIILMQPELCSSIYQNGHKKAVELFSADAVAKQIVDFVSKEN